MIAGRLSKSNVNIVLTGNVIKRQLRLPLTPEEQEAEERLNAESELIGPEELLPPMPGEVGGIGPERGITGQPDHCP